MGGNPPDGRTQESTLLLLWTDGATSLTIDSSGLAVGTHQEFGRTIKTTPLTVSRLTLKPAEVDALKNLLRALDVCAIRSKRSNPMPGERTRQLSLSFPGLQCVVALMANEWNSEPKPRACSRVIETVLERVNREGVSEVIAPLDAGH